MNALIPSETQAVQLVDIIDFKWLMAGIGHHVHVERLQSDAAYADQVLAVAEAAADPGLRAAAARLRRMLARPGA